MRDIQERQKSIQESYMEHKAAWNPSYIKDQLLALMMEAAEAMNETPWKAWKKHQALDKPKFISELVDIQLFLLNLVNEAELDNTEFIKLCREKQQKNVARYLRGY